MGIKNNNNEFPHNLVNQWDISHKPQKRYDIKEFKVFHNGTF